MRIFNQQKSMVRRWSDLVLLVTSAAAVLIDPLFLYILRINYRTRSETSYMIELHKTLLISAITLRSIADLFCGPLHVFFKFRTAPNISTIARKCRYFLPFLLVNFLALLPLPQGVVLVGLIFIEATRTRVVTPTITWLQLVLFLQLAPRLLRFYMVYQDVIKSYAIRKVSFMRIAITIFLFITAAHVVGAFWYSFSILRETDCWQLACRNHAGCDYVEMLTFGNDPTPRPPRMDYSSILNRTCPKLGSAESSIDYGMFADAVKSGMLESRNFDKKFLFSFWWGVQSLSTLGQNVKPSINSLEIGFALCIFISGLLFFSQVIGIIQTRMLTSTIRMEEMNMKWEDVERWMSSHSIPMELQRRLKRHQELRWRTDQGVDFKHLLDVVPKNLRMEVKRYLGLPLLKKVPMFENIDKHLLDAMCDHLKSALYIEGSYIVHENDPVEEMLFITKGKLKSTTTNHRMEGLDNSVCLEYGDFCGKELLTYLTTSPPQPTLVLSTTTVLAITEVEAFALSTDDFKHLASEFPHAFRVYSQHDDLQPDSIC